MKKLIIMVIGLVLALAGAGLAADSPAKDKAQAACAVMGGPINKSLYADYKGQRVYFCCPSCSELFKKDPEKYLKKMKDQGIAPEKSPAGK